MSARQRGRFRSRPRDPSRSRTASPTRYYDFAPRIGVVYDPFGDGKNRHSCELWHLLFHRFRRLYNSNYGRPFLPSANILETPSLVNPAAALNYPPPAGIGQFVLPATTAWMNPNNVTPYVEQYNFTIERQLMHNLSLVVAYVGNSQRHLQQQRDANAPIYIPGESTSANANPRCPVEPGIIAAISEAEAAANADYNASQVTLNRRFSRGLTFLANYALSKAMDFQSADQQSVATITFVDNNNLRLDRGPATFDTRHIFNLSFVWEPPNINSLGFIARRILIDWQVNRIARYTSGRPFTVTSAVDTNLDGNYNDRRDLIGDPNLLSGRCTAQMLAAYFNPTAFQRVATGSDGTAGRDILYGPGFANDLSFFKNIRVREAQHLQFRAEFFKTLHNLNSNPPVAGLSNSNVGLIFGAGPGRVIQFALKYIFRL